MTTHLLDSVAVTKAGIARRRFLHSVSATAVATGTLGFRDAMATAADELRRQGRSMILLWMQGGPSQFETFDPKPGTDNGGPTQAIATAVPGIHIADNFPQLARQLDDIAIIRSMTNKEGSHPRATYQLHTGYVPSGSVRHPALGSCIAEQIARPDCELPAFVSIGSRTQGAGFLGMEHEPFVVNQAGALPRNVALPTSVDRFQRRQGLLTKLDLEFAKAGAADMVRNHQALYRTTADLVLTPEISAFDTSQESQALRDRYGDNNFGKGCLLARRLVERGVTFVEVRSGNWDTHQDNFERSAQNAAEVDPATAALLTDLKDRGLLDSTLVVWMGEFGRTPQINARTGRDHYPRVFNMALAGCGIRGGQVYGASTADGSAIDHSPVTVADLFQTICQALHVDANHENLSPLGRPMKIVDGGHVVPGLLTS